MATKSRHLQTHNVTAMKKVSSFGNALLYKQHKLHDIIKVLVFVIINCSTNKYMYMHMYAFFLFHQDIVTAGLICSNFPKFLGGKKISSTHWCFLQ